MYSPSHVRDRASALPSAPKRRGAPPLDPTRDFKEFDKINAERERRMPRWKEIFWFFMHNRQAFEIEKKNEPVRPIDSYPPHALQRGAGNVAAALFRGKFVDLVAGEDFPEDQHDDINEALERFRDTMFATLGRCGWNAQLNALLIDVFASLSAMRIERGPSRAKPLSLRTIPMAELYPIFGAGGASVGMMRKYEIEAALLEAEFATYSAKLDIPQEIRERGATDPAFKVTLLEVSRSIDGVGQRCTVYLWNSKHPILDHVGYDKSEPSAWAVAGWTKVAGESYPRGPADRALESAKLLNFVEDIEARCMAKDADPPLAIAVESQINGNALRMTPQSVVEYSTQLLEGGAPFTAFPTSGTGMQYRQIKREELKADLDTYLFSSPVLPPVEESHGMTLGEVQIRAQQKLREEGADFDHLMEGFGQDATARILWVLGTWGIVPSFLKIDGHSFAIRPSGPLAAAQDAQDASNDLVFIQHMKSTLDPEMFHIGVKTEDATSIIGDKMNASRGLIRPESERNKLLQAMMQQMAAQAEAAAQGTPAA